MPPYRKGLLVEIWRTVLEGGVRKSKIKPSSFSRVLLKTHPVDAGGIVYHCNRPAYLLACRLSIRWWNTFSILSAQMMANGKRRFSRSNVLLLTFLPRTCAKNQSCSLSSARSSSSQTFPAVAFRCVEDSAVDSMAAGLPMSVGLLTG